MAVSQKSTAGQKAAGKDATAQPFGAWLSPWQAYLDYATDFGQRAALYSDVMRRRGNQYLEHAAQPAQHVLHFEFEPLMDGRKLERPVNYVLVRIRPPEGVEIDDNKRPFVIVDPRAGHGPGIGGFKPDSQVGAILKAGHPCYFIGFLSEPVPGQTLEDVGRAEAAFLRRVIELHPSVEGKPCVIANCQAGWAMMMLAAVTRDLIGPILVAGSPLSYWAGVTGKNPMRYLGGLLGGTWMTALAGDLGDGIFDGANLVQNFESLNPAHSLWGKQYNLWSKVDTEPERYLEFERWWGGHVLLTADEMLSIANELFVGNRLVRGELQTSDGIAIDLRNIRSPIVVFCSQGDNITPPQQALNWILDLYRDVNEIRANGQTIVYALHHNIGHLGIFVSGSVGRKEYDQFTQNMDLIDVLPPGLYEAVIREKTPEDSNAELAAGDYVVTFEARSLDDIRALDDGDQDIESQLFETAARVSDVNLSLYQTLLAPFVQAAASDAGAKWLREMHPARLQYSLFSDRNPFMAWTAAAAEQAEAARQPVADDNPYLQLERQVSDGIESWLKAWGTLRDQAVEQFFFSFYGAPAVQAAVGLKTEAAAKQSLTPARDPGEMALLRERIRELQDRIPLGGPREAAARALLYAGLPDGRVDERAFGALRAMHARQPEGKRLSLKDFKQLVREQFCMLLVDEKAALAALPNMLPKSAAERQALWNRILEVSTAAGAPSPLRQQHLQTLAEIFGFEAPVFAGSDGPQGGKGAAAEKALGAAAAQPRRRASKSGAPARSAGRRAAG